MDHNGSSPLPQQICNSMANNGATGPQWSRSGNVVEGGQLITSYGDGYNSTSSQDSTARASVLLDYRQHVNYDDGGDTDFVSIDDPYVRMASMAASAPRPDMEVTPLPSVEKTPIAPLPLTKEEIEEQERADREFLLRAVRPVEPTNNRVDVPPPSKTVGSAVVDDRPPSASSSAQQARVKCNDARKPAMITRDRIVPLPIGGRGRGKPPVAVNEWTWVELDVVHHEHCRGSKEANKGGRGRGRPNIECAKCFRIGEK